jgi:hypothetical protein
MQDNRAPQLTVDYPSGTSWYVYNCPGGIPGHWTDPESGFHDGKFWIYYNGSQVEFSDNSTDYEPVPGLWSTSNNREITCKPGTYKIAFQATDNVGNTSSIYEFNYTVNENPTETNPSSPVIPTGSSGSCQFDTMVTDPSYCHNGYVEVKDIGRYPMFGCKTEGSSSTITITGTSYYIQQNPIGAWDGSYNYFYSEGQTGTKFYWLSCNASSCSSSSTGYKYIPGSCTHTKTGSTSYTNSCTYNKTACTKYRNGQEWLASDNTSLTYMCCK